ncbi:MAG: transposase [Alkaliphilus sp.]
MVRLARQESDTGYYHIIMRGNNKNRIFKEEKNKLDFIKMLKNQEEEKRIQLLAWCIMDNHVHIVVKADIKDMSLAIKKINVKYAMRHNHKEGTIGHVFQDRFKSQPIETDEHLMQVIRYVHNNPIKAKMIEKIQNYNWSSYNYYYNKEEVKSRNQMQFVLKYFNNDLEEFAKFHEVNDFNEYLDIKEDIMEYRMEKAQDILDYYCKKYSMTKVKELNHDKEILKEIVEEIIEKSGLSLRKTAEFLKIPYSFVQQANQRMKNNIQSKRTVPNVPNDLSTIKKNRP